MVLCIGMQLVCGVLFSVVASAVKTASLMQQGITDMAVIQEQAIEFTMGNVMWAIVIFHVLALITFSLWYYFGCGKPKPAKVKNVLTPKTVVGSVITGFGLQFFTTCGVVLVSKVLPDLIWNYQNSMNNAGMASVTLESVIAMVILAPIGEEILCRGLTFYYAKKVSSNFMIANCIQALAFGVMHMNLVQGTYAFIMGLVLGVLYERFHSLYLCILVHFVVNFLGVLVADIILAPVPDTVLAMAAIMILGLAAWIVGLKIVGKPVEKEKEAVMDAVI